MTVWVRALWRRHVVASVVLAVLAGVAMAVPVALWSAARRSADSVERFLAVADAPDLVMTFCPPGFDPETATLDECFAYEPRDEFELLQSMPEVGMAARLSWSFVRVGRGGDPSTWDSQAVLSVRDPVDLPTAYGHPVVVEGHLPDPSAADEIAMTEAAAHRLDVRAGDELLMQVADGLDEASDGPTVVIHVTAVIRHLDELIPMRGEDALSFSVPTFHAGPAWAHAHLGPDARATSIEVRLADGVTDAAFASAVEARFPGRLFASDPAIEPVSMQTMRQAVGYESRALLVVGALSALAVVCFVGQAVARQARRETANRDILAALGTTSRQLSGAVGWRWLPVAAAAAGVSVAAALMSSSLGPVGLARRGPWEASVEADVLPLAAAAAASLLLVLAASVVGARRRRNHAMPRRAMTATAPSPVIAAGLALASTSTRRGGSVPVVSAILGTAVAVAVLVAAVTGASTIRAVTSNPASFGVTWDAFVGSGEADTIGDTRDRLLDLDVASAVAMVSGDTVDAPRGQLWVQAFVPLAGFRAIRPVVTSGAEPVADDEIALGSVVLEREGLEVGDRIELQGRTTGPVSFLVVGTTMVSDGYEPNVGVGGVVTPAGLARLAPGVVGSVALRIDGTRDREAAVAALREAFPDSYNAVAVPSTLDNIERVSHLPIVLGIVTAVLAGVTLTHALLVSVRRQRIELAVCKALGFTRAQVSVSVAMQATVFGLAALAVGLPLGVVAGRLVWRAIGDGVGLAAGPIVPPWVIVACVGGVLLVGNVVAAGPGWLAARLPPARTLRSE